VYEKRVLRRIFGPNREEETADWTKLYEELHTLHFSSTVVIKVFKSRQIGWVGVCSTHGNDEKRINLLQFSPKTRRE
jgi:hypothetical protein